MRLVIISSDPDGGVRLVSERVFADAAEATRELARSFAEGAADASASYYTVDIDAAVPVIVLQPSAEAAGEAMPAAPEPALGAFEMPEETVETAADEPLAAVAGADEPGAAVTLTGSPALEDVAAEPPAVEEAEDEMPALGDLAAEPPAFDDTTAEPPALDIAAEPPVEDANATETAELEEPAEEEAPEEPVVEPAAEEPAAETTPQWPWDLPIVVPEGAVDDAVPEPEPAEDLLEEASAESLPEPESDIDAVPDPGQLPALVEIGAEEPAEAMPTEETIAVDFGADDSLGLDVLEDPAPQSAPEAEPETPAEEIAAIMDEVAEPQSVIDMSGPSGAADESQAPAQERVYEPGALNMSEYTCDDCVYVNTCPNQHQKKPAECGSFQWRSV